MQNKAEYHILVIVKRSLKRVFKKIRYLFLEALFRFFLWASSFSSCGSLRAIARFLVMNFLYRSNNRMVRNGQRTVRLAYGKEKTGQEQKALLRASFEHLADVVGEVIYYADNPDDACKMVTIEGREFLDEALSRGQGVVAVTAHFGNFPLMVYWMALNGYKVNVIMRRPREHRIAEYVLRKSSQCGMRVIYTIPNRQCVQEALRALRRGEILFILLDQNYGADARVNVKFFGRDSATGASPVIFVQRTGATVVPMFCVRREDDTHCIHVEPSVELDIGGEEQNDLTVNIQRIVDVIERYIRKYPSLWAWMHNRWKDRTIE
jgi:KDO2-lipid IV(A) lauroyltransferase